MCWAHVFSFPWIFIPVMDETLWSIIPLNPEAVSWQFLTSSSLQESVIVNPSQLCQYQTGPGNSLGYSNCCPVFGCPPAIHWSAEVLSIWHPPLAGASCWGFQVTAAHHQRPDSKIRCSIFNSVLISTMFYQCASKPGNFSYPDFKH